jgi:hypothetical protein
MIENDSSAFRALVRRVSQLIYFPIGKGRARSQLAGAMRAIPEAPKPMKVGVHRIAPFASPAPPPPFQFNHDVPRPVAGVIFVRIVIRGTPAMSLLPIRPLHERPNRRGKAPIIGQWIISEAGIVLGALSGDGWGRLNERATTD